MATPQPKTVLVVDDSPDDQTLILRALRRHNPALRALVARDGREALRILQAETDALRPDLVLLDMKMPGLTGLDVLSALRADARTRDLVVVIFSSSTREQDVRDSLSAGATAYARKPVSFPEFSQAVRDVADRWLGTGPVGVAQVGAPEAGWIPFAGSAAASYSAAK